MIDSDKSIRMSRQELYKKVWSTPVVKLAKQFGLSDVGLAKICKRHNVPRPPRACARLMARHALCLHIYIMGERKALT